MIDDDHPNGEAKLLETNAEINRGDLVYKLAVEVGGS